MDIKNPIKEVVSVRKYRAGYEVRTELYNGELYHCADFTIKSAYTLNGDYIGNGKIAYYLCKKKGIVPEKRTANSSICSIGFCEREQKWYGYSHRAIFGFGIGSECKKRDCHYLSNNWEELKDRSFFGEPCFSLENNLCAANCTVELRKPNDEEIASNKYSLGELVPIEGTRTPPQECCKANCVHRIGRGEWIAKTLADAKQMAMDFAEGVG